MGLQRRMFAFLHILAAAGCLALAAGQTPSCNSAIYFEKNHPWNKGYVAKLYLDQSWLTYETSEWRLNITFNSKVDEFQIWDADIINPMTTKNYVYNVTQVEIVAKCWNPVLYSCQFLEVPFLVRFPETDMNTMDYDVVAVSESVTYNDEATGTQTYCAPIPGQPTSAAGGTGRK